MNIYTGTRINCEGIGWWSFVICYPDGVNIRWGNSFSSCSEKELDLICVYKACEQLVDGKFIIHTSSSYVYNGISLCEEWCKNGWISKNGKQIKNHELWKLIYEKSQDISLILCDMKHDICEALVVKACQ
jgi:ribonuclease HI